MTEHRFDPHAPIGDTVKFTTCYMCACRCGIRVHLKDGKVRYIDGNPDHPVNHGVVCAKGSAGPMQQASPAKLRAPLLRTGPRGSGEFKEIGWDEAMELATTWLRDAREKDPRKLAFFTGRDQSQSLTGWWAQAYGTPNFAAHGGFCSVNMAAAGLYTLGAAFWEFGEPDWEHARLFLLWGVAEDHDSNPLKLGLAKLKETGGKTIAFNPVRTGYAAVADEWVPIRPGTDGALVLALVHELLRTQRVDLEFLVRFTNAGWLVLDAPGESMHGLFARDEAGAPLCWDRTRNEPADARQAGTTPLLHGGVTLPDGRRARPVFDLVLGRYVDPSAGPDAASAITGLPAARIRALAAEIAAAAFEHDRALPVAWTDWAGRRHESMPMRPVAMHAMRGISAHANGFQTARALHVLQMLLGAIEAPGSWRCKSPYPRPTPPAIKPGGKLGETAPNRPLPRPPLGFPTGPEDLLVDEDGGPLRIDLAYSWTAPVAAHGLMHLVIRNAWAADPYPVDVLFMYMANMAWNSAMNTTETIEMLTEGDGQGGYRIPRIIYSDAFASETVAYADLILPDTTYLERWDALSLLDRPIGKAEGPADSIRQPVIQPDRDVRPFQDVLLDLGARLGLPGMVTEAGTPRYRDYAHYLATHERAPGIGPLAGWRGDGSQHGKGPANPDQLRHYVQNGAFWHQPLPIEAQYFKHGNKAYLEHAAAMGFLAHPEPIVMQLYLEPMQKFRLAAEGHGPIQPPEHLRERVRTAFDPLPFWYPPFEGSLVPDAAFPLAAITQRPAGMYHSWGSQNAWLRQIYGENRLYLNRGTAAALSLEDDDWAWVISHHGRILVQVRTMEGCEANTVWTWNAIGKRAGAWTLDPRSPEATTGFLLNHLINDQLPGGTLPNADPITGQAAWFDLRVRLEKADAPADRRTSPHFPELASPPGLGRSRKVPA